MKHWFCVLPLAACMLYSCQQKPAVQDSFTINGNISGLEDSSYLYLRYANGDSLQVDSSLINGGKFTFEGATGSPVRAIIYEAGFAKYFQFYLENAKIEITGNADSLKNVAVTGSASQKDFLEMQAKLKPATEKNMALRKLYSEARKANDEAKMTKLIGQMDSLQAIRENITKAFIKNHPKSYVSLDELQRLIYGNDFTVIDSMYKGLDTAIQHSPKGEKLAKYLDILAKTAIGQPAPAFTQNDSSGKAVKLADFKGKYVLVDFWASWCGPCRRENPNVVKAYNKYKDKNFTILGVSLDDTKADWTEAIADDGLVWTQVSDLKGWKNEVAQQYGVRAIPANFLISPEGVIIAHNLRGEQLENKLKEVLE